MIEYLVVLLAAVVILLAPIPSIRPGKLPDNASVLTQLSAALRTRFNAEETAKILGGNYRRVFEASVG